jgi:hypothetical protein
MKKTMMRLAALLLLSGSNLSASVIYLVKVDTTAISGQSGNLDFQFNPGNIDSQAATASVNSFSTSGTLGNPAIVTGDVTPANASLPASFTLGNSTGFNDVFQPITFGTTVSFLVTLGGAALNSPNGTSTSGSVFAFSLYDAAGTTPLLSSAADGSVVDLAVNLNGSTTATTESVAAATVIPEPGSCVFLAIGLAGLALARFRR